MRCALAAILAALVGAALGQSDGYSPLARVLFDQRHPPGEKVKLVRELLDAGASPNGDHGGWGRWGALGHTRRADRDVIELLLARGATLSGTTSGPVTLAIEMERDDLALGLIRREAKLAPQDRNALPLAAKRGWGEVARALLTAGADVEARDAQGRSAIDYAVRRRDPALQQALAAAGAKPASAAPRARPGPGADFAAAAAIEIDDVAFFDPPRFALSSSQGGSFAFYGAGPLDPPREARCERSAAFDIIAMANQAGAIQVGICQREARRVRELAAASRAGLETVLDLLAQGAPGFDRAALASKGVTYAKSAGVRGEEHYFALLLVGHGVIAVPTVILAPRDGKAAIVVQANLERLCANYGLETQTPLCQDTRRALTDIARRLEARYAR